MSSELTAPDQRGLKHQPVRNVTSVILAGGRSLRFGKNKALVKINGVSMIEKISIMLGSLFQHLILITNSPGEYSFLKLSMYEDIIKGIGPLGGIFTGLTVMSDNAGFFIACDMPFLNRPLIRHMVEIRKDYDAVIPRVSGKIEPLYGLYHKRCLPAVERLISSGDYRIADLFKEISTLYIEKEEIRSFDPGLYSFININRPGEIGTCPKTLWNEVT